MNRKPFYYLETRLDKYLDRKGLSFPLSGLVDEPPEHEDADLAISLAMKAADELGTSPREVASELAEFLEETTDRLENITVAGPGFVNCDFSDQALMDWMDETAEKGGLDLRELGEGDRVLLEFVSANPTGPLHVGHGRGAIYGDVLGRLLEAHGYDVTREYYVNDAGEQIRRLGESLLLRAREEAGEEVELGENHYRGDYVTRIVREEGITPDYSVEECSEIGQEKLLDRIFQDLEDCHIGFDSVVHENKIATDDAVQDLIDGFRDQGYVYEDEGAVYLETTREGDDKDRVLIKQNGDPTYFANDLVYHNEKYERSFDRYINVWGHDHHGYQPRVRAGLKLLERDVECLDIELYQLVDLFRDGEPVSMSTREGEFVPLADLVEEVGIEPVRFNFLTKRHSRPLDFDIEVATSRTDENPVYYAQYAHTRLSSILDEADVDPFDDPVSKDLTEEGHDLVLDGLNFARTLAEATESRSPHKVTNYLLELARNFHSYYSKHRVLDEEYPERSRLRLRLVNFLRVIFEKGLNFLGVSAPHQM